MQSVFVLTEGLGEGEDILGVYQTLDDAKITANSMQNADLLIREWELGARQDRGWWYCSGSKKGEKCWRKYAGELNLIYDAKNV